MSDNIVPIVIIGDEEVSLSEGTLLSQGDSERFEEQFRELGTEVQVKEMDVAGNGS